MRRFKLTALLVIVLCVFIAVPSYCKDSSKPAKQAAGQGISKAKKEKSQFERENQKQISVLYKKALLYYFKGELIESKNTFEQILEIAPDEKKAQRYIDKNIPAKQKRLGAARSKK